MAGFEQYPLSSYVNSVIRSLLRTYSEHYTLVEKDEAMLLDEKDRNLFLLILPFYGLGSMELREVPLNPYRILVSHRL
uniref:Uncharacterized protein n=1 Tax=Salix viminalis TaxID=40686 RepID=A0A6N2ME86_SALVM